MNYILNEQHGESLSKLRAKPLDPHARELRAGTITPVGCRGLAPRCRNFSRPAEARTFAHSRRRPCLCRQLCCAGLKIAVIENEFGEVNIDEDLVAENMQFKEDVISMDNGRATALPPMSSRATERCPRCVPSLRPRRAASRST